MAAMTRLLLTSAALRALLVGATTGSDAVPAAVLAAGAWLAMQALDRRAAAAEAGLPVAEPG